MLDVVARPGMFLADRSLDMAVGVIVGVDVAHGSEPFGGFSDWLVARYRLVGTGRHWAALALDVHSPRGEEALDAFWRDLREYLEASTGPAARSIEVDRP